jgi:hypothetical protein
MLHPKLQLTMKPNGQASLLTCEYNLAFIKMRKKTKVP